MVRLPPDLVVWSQTTSGFRGILYRLFTVGVTDISPKSVALDAKLGWILSRCVGIPSAFLLHGYVGFIFGSIKANPWWGNVLMPIISFFRRSFRASPCACSITWC